MKSKEVYIITNRNNIGIYTSSRKILNSYFIHRIEYSLNAILLTYNTSICYNIKHPVVKKKTRKQQTVSMVVCKFKEKKGQYLWDDEDCEIAFKRSKRIPTIKCIEEAGKNCPNFRYKSNLIFLTFSKLSYLLQINDIPFMYFLWSIYDSFIIQLHFCYFLFSTVSKMLIFTLLPSCKNDVSL